ncbi:DivIVA domain-containing protein [Mycobacterium sp. C3-094]
MGEQGLTADELRNVTFSKPPWGKRGYDEKAVDALLDEIASALAHLDG